MPLANSVFVAIDMSKPTWLVALHTPSDGRTGQHKLEGGNVPGLLSLIGRARSRQARTTKASVPVCCCFEAGYDGFWLARRLHAEQIETYVIDPASLRVDRRAKRAKTDRIDVGGLLRAIMSLHRGDSDACRLVPIPSPEDEDAKRTHRERQRLVKERTGHINRIKGLLATQGIYEYQPLKQDRRSRLHELRTGDGRSLPERLQREISRELDRLELVIEQIDEIEQERDAAINAAAVPEGTLKAGALMGSQLLRLRGVGAETATILVREGFYRSFANRKALASYAGLTPSPHASGQVNRDQGLDTSGNALLRKTMVELAWMWLRHQPSSVLSCWFRERVGEQKGRIRRITIVALARKLLIALWRYATTGLVPTGAILKA
jgi:transposase